MNIREGSALHILEKSRELNLLVFNLHLNEYAGFFDFKNINDFLFENMSYNRTVNSNVIDNRVDLNVRKYMKDKTFYNFGTIKLAIITDQSNINYNKFWIMDGQHRINVTKQLITKLGPDISLWINVSVTCLENDDKLKDFLRLYQQQYPPDLRLFANSLEEKETKQFLIKTFRDYYPKAFTKYDEFLNKVICNIQDHEIDIDNKNCKGIYTYTHYKEANISDPIVADLYSRINIFNKRNSDNSSYILQNIDKIKEINDYMYNIFDAEANISAMDKVNKCSYYYIYNRAKQRQTFKLINDKFV